MQTLRRRKSLRDIYFTVQVGISSVWYEGNPCNMHLLDLADQVKQGVYAAGMVGYRLVLLAQLCHSDHAHSFRHSFANDTCKSPMPLPS